MHRKAVAPGLTPDLPAWVPLSGQPQIHLLDRRRGLERLSGLLPRHSLCGQLAQFVADQRQQPAGRVRVSRLQPQAAYSFLPLSSRLLRKREGLVS
jgi:hypothetical protein